MAGAAEEPILVSSGTRSQVIKSGPLLKELKKQVDRIRRKHYDDMPSFNLIVEVLKDKNYSDMLYVVSMIEEPQRIRSGEIEAKDLTGKLTQMSFFNGIIMNTGYASVLAESNDLLDRITTKLSLMYRGKSITKAQFVDLKLLIEASASLVELYLQMYRAIATKATEQIDTLDDDKEKAFIETTQRKINRLFTYLRTKATQSIGLEIKDPSLAEERLELIKRTLIPVRGFFGMEAAAAAPAPAAAAMEEGGTAEMEEGGTQDTQSMGDDLEDAAEALVAIGKTEGGKRKSRRRKSKSKKVKSMYRKSRSKPKRRSKDKRRQSRKRRASKKRQ